MRFKGAAIYEEFSSLLDGESPRGTVIVVAAFFDEMLAEKLGGLDGSFSARINAGLANNLLTANEHRDLHELRAMRNSFAHDLRAMEFDSAKTAQVDGLKTWQIASGELSTYPRLLATPRERLLYVASTIAVRLIGRVAKSIDPLSEPALLNVDAWPPITDR